MDMVLPMVQNHLFVKPNGAGQVMGVQRTVFGQVRTNQTCPSCQGSGRTIVDHCTKCKLVEPWLINGLMSQFPPE